MATVNMSLTKCNDAEDLEDHSTNGSSGDDETRYKWEMTYSNNKRSVAEQPLRQTP